MRARATGCQFIVVGSLFALSSLFVSHAANAHYRHLVHARVIRHSVRHIRFAHSWGGISCVPYARLESGIDLPGNAWEWWYNAVGVYARGREPQPGAVLAFRANVRMRLGHVAVVERVINARVIEVNQANWVPQGRVSHGVPVVDVSEDNNWTSVRVGLAADGSFGAVYPTYGFIYDRADTGVMLASPAPPTPKVALGPAPGDLRPIENEVADAPGSPPAISHYHPHLRHTLRVSLRYRHVVRHRPR
jgi:CHAP domain